MRNVGADNMTTYIFLWLLVGLTLSLVLSHLRHHRKMSAQIEEGVADAQGILDSTAEGIITTNSSGEITKFNLAAERIFGYKAGNVMGKNFQLLLSDETRKANEHIMSGPSLHAVGHSSHEFMARRSNGVRFPLTLTVTHIQKHGKTVFMGLCRDISARKQTEANNRKGQRLIEFLLQSSPVVFYTCYLDGGLPINYVSPNVEKLLGYKPETITNTSAFWLQHVHEDDRNQIQSSRIVQLKEDREDLEYRLKLSDGSYRWIADSRTVVNDESGEPALIIGCWTDIHETKDAAINLALKEDRLRISLKYANLATWDWGINTGKVIWSSNMTEELGFPDGLLNTFDDLIESAHPKDREDVSAAFRQSLVCDEAFNQEFRLVWPDKSIHWVHLLGELLNDENGSPIRMAGVMYDITQQKRLHAAPQLNVKMA